MAVTMSLNTRRLKIMSLIKDLSGPVVARVLYTSVEAVLTPRVRRRLRKNKSVDTGNLFRNIRAKVAIDTNPVQASVDFGSIGVNYGLNVEEGTPPHQPIINRLRGWVRRKVNVKNVKQATFLIARKIRKKGTKPHPYLKPVTTSNENRLADDFTARLKVFLKT